MKEEYKKWLESAISAREKTEQTKGEIELNILREAYKMLDIVDHQPERKEPETIGEIVEAISDLVATLDWKTRDM